MILVTGGTGLIGSHLLCHLAKNNTSVRALIRDKKKIDSVKKIFSYYTAEPDKLVKSIDWVNGDILDPYSLNNAFKGVRKVYHCAAVVSIGGIKGNDLIENNVSGTENVVNLSLEHSIEKLCHVSSIAALGSSVNGALIDENNKWTSSKNRSAYSISKYKSEMEVWRGIQEGLSAVIVNPSVVLGPGFWNSGSGSLFNKAAKGMKFYTKGLTGFVDVRDVVDSMVKLMESNIKNERFIISSENIYYKDLFSKIANEIGIKPPKKEASEYLLKMAVVLDSVISNLGLKKKEITKEIVKASVSQSYYSNKKIVDIMGKTFISIDDSIEYISEKFKNDLTIN